MNAWHEQAVTAVTRAFPRKLCFHMSGEQRATKERQNTQCRRRQEIYATRVYAVFGLYQESGQEKPAKSGVKPDIWAGLFHSNHWKYFSRKSRALYSGCLDSCSVSLLAIGFKHPCSLGVYYPEATSTFQPRKMNYTDWCPLRLMCFNVYHFLWGVCRRACK